MNQAIPFFSGHSQNTMDFTEEQAWFIKQRQIWAMASKWPEFEIVSDKKLNISLHQSFRSKTVWIGPIQPSDLSRVYLVEVHFALVAMEYPFVKIIDPQIPYHKDIHMFERRGNLCLFDSRIQLYVLQSPRQAYYNWVKTGVWPGDSEWNIMSLIADTTIPWTAEWLLQYEAWKITGEWLGGGHKIDEAHVSRSLSTQLQLHRLGKIIKKRSRLLKRKRNAA